MPKDQQRPTLTIAFESDNGERTELSQQPIDIFAAHPSFVAPFYEAIGKIVIQSGHIEDMLRKVVSLCRQLETKYPPQAGKIREAGRKIDAIRKAIKHGRIFDEPAEHPLFSGMLAAAVAIGKKRNEIVHGIVVGFEEGPPNRIRLVDYGADTPNAEPRENAYTLSELHDIVSKMQEAHLLLGGLGLVLQMDNVVRAGRQNQ